MSNRRNALKSTGPKTEEGKRRSSRNALRHGLTAETVIEPIEDPDDYKACEASVTAEYDAETVIERELVLRLASLMWRLRRAGAIETGLMQIESGPTSLDEAIEDTNSSNHCPAHTWNNEYKYPAAFPAQANATAQSVIEIARCFLQLPMASFALLGRYEAALWRQARQTIVALDRKHRRETTRNRRRQALWRDEM
jgi:hypothetical protein